MDIEQRDWSSIPSDRQKGGRGLQSPHRVLLFFTDRPKSSQLILYREIIAVCSEIHTKHINTLCGAERKVAEC